MVLLTCRVVEREPGLCGAGDPGLSASDWCGRHVVRQAWVVERMGKYCHVMEPGLNLLLPVVDRVKYVQNMKEQAIDIPQQSAITAGEATAQSRS